MSLHPYLFDYGVQLPRRLFDQNFGIGLRDDDLINAASSPIISRYRPIWPRDVTVTSSPKNDRDNFQVNVDIQHFAPEEISVKIANGFIIVEAKHEEKKDEHGYVSRQFNRRYNLPEECSPDQVQSRLSSDGVLTIVAPKKDLKGERSVPISHTGPVRKDVKDEAPAKEIPVTQEEAPKTESAEAK